MDMIILAAIAAFIVYRLYVTLGEKTGFQGDDQTSHNVVDFQRKPSPSVPTHPSQDQDVDEVPDHLEKDIQRIKKIDKTFMLKDFIENATVAFEVILEAYAGGDRKTLNSLLSKDVFSTFDKTLKALEDQGHNLDITLVRVEEAAVKTVSISGKIARIQILFTTEQVALVKDQFGDVIDGHPNQIDQITDYWTFERDLKSSDPRWTLVSTDE